MEELKTRKNITDINGELLRELIKSTYSIVKKRYKDIN